jgi:flagellar export protein FliJ
MSTRRCNAVLTGYTRWRHRGDVNNSRKRLGRIFRIRQMEEDQARLGLESSVAVLRRTQMQVGEALEAELEARVRRNSALVDPMTETNGWLWPESEGQIQRVVAVRAARGIPRLEAEIQAKRDGYFERRRERQKLENLLHKAEEKESLEMERKSRAELDDLVQARRRYEWLRAQEDQS